MSSYATVTGIRTGLLAVLSGITDIGVVLSHYEPVKDKREFLATYWTTTSGGSDEIRGVLVTPGIPFHREDPMAVGGLGMTKQDVWRLDVTFFRAAERDPALRDAALQRALDAFDLVRAKFDFSAQGVSLLLAPVYSIRTHGWGPLAGVGCWITECEGEYTTVSEHALT